MGDLNALASLCRRVDQSGIQLVEFIHGNNAVILNEPGQPTSYWSINGIRSNNILDLLVATEMFYDKLIDYKVLAHCELNLYQKDHYHVPVACTFQLTKKTTIDNQSKR